MPPSAHEILTDPEWLAHRYDRPKDLIRFLHVPRARHRTIAFLTDDEIGEAARSAIDRSEAVAQATPGPVHFIFHSAFCASTMLVRALDYPGVAMGLSEPVLLNDIVGFRRRGEFQPPQVARALEEALLLLSRPFGADEAVIVKPSNILNTLAGAMMAIRPDSKALLLHAPLPVFLASVARKGMWCRLWARELLAGLLIEGAVDLGFEPDDYFRLTDLQVAAIGWLAQHSLFHHLVARFGTERIKTLDSESLMTDQPGKIAALGAHFGLAAQGITRLANADALARHSKDGRPFDATLRREEQEKAHRAYGEEIEKVVFWAETIAAQRAISLNLPAAL